MSDSWKPEGYPALSPYLVVRDAEAVIRFITDTLDATPLRRFGRPDGSVMHAEFRVGDVVVMIGQVGEGDDPVPCTLHLYVPDVDRVFARAVENGGTVVQEPVRRSDDPDRRGGVKGPGGNHWWFATQMEEEGA